MEGEAGIGEVKKNEVKLEEKPWRRRLGEYVYGRLHPEVARLHERLPWIDELNLPQPALEWIGECSDLDDKERAENKDQEILTGFDLIDLHLMMLREQYMGGSGVYVDRKIDYLREQRERKVDKILVFMTTQETGRMWSLSDYEKKWKERKEKKSKEFDYPTSLVDAGVIFSALDKYHSAKTLEDKESALSRLLQIWHSGGDTNIGLLNFKGIPQINTVIGTSERVFLYKLDNYDRSEFWEKEIRPFQREQARRTYSYFAEKNRGSSNLEKVPGRGYW